MSAPVCPYCGGEAILRTGKDIYQRLTQLRDLPFWCCPRCDAHVGCHKGTTTPLGTLADKELRTARMRAHQAFDGLWKLGKLRRHEAYAWLALELNLTRDECHIGRFDLDTCLKAIALCAKGGERA